MSAATWSAGRGPGKVDADDGLADTDVVGICVDIADTDRAVATVPAALLTAEAPPEAVPATDVPGASDRRVDERPAFSHRDRVGEIAAAVKSDRAVAAERTSMPACGASDSRRTTVAGATSVDCPLMALRRIVAPEIRGNAVGAAIPHALATGSDPAEYDTGACEPKLTTTGPGGNAESSDPAAYTALDASLDRCRGPAARRDPVVLPAEADGDGSAVTEAGGVDVPFAASAGVAASAGAAVAASLTERRNTGVGITGGGITGGGIAEPLADVASDAALGLAAVAGPRSAAGGVDPDGPGWAPGLTPSAVDAVVSGKEAAGAGVCADRTGGRAFCDPGEVIPPPATALLLTAARRTVGSVARSAITSVSAARRIACCRSAADLCGSVPSAA